MVGSSLRRAVLDCITAWNTPDDDARAELLRRLLHEVRGFFGRWLGPTEDHGDDAAL